MRKPHMLSRNKANRYPREFIFYDTETDPIELDPEIKLHKLRLGWANYLRLDELGKIHTDEWREFRTHSEFWEFVFSKARSKSKLYVIAHNQHFDFNVVGGFKWLGREKWKITKLILDSSRFYVQARKNGKALAFLDTFNYVKAPVRKLGKVVGLEKLSVDFSTVSDGELSVYCKRDVEIIRKWFLRYLQFIRKENLGNFGFTVSQQAFNAFRHRFMTHPICIHADQDALRLERESYRGGRSEAFFIGEVPEDRIFYLDVNSLYPYVMRKFKYPTRLVFMEKYPSKKGLYHALEHYGVIAKVHITINEPAIGIKRNKLIFPVGSFWCTLTTPELRYVLDHARINKVAYYAAYEMKPIFVDYVDYFYDLKTKAKKEGDQVTYQLAKLFLNSLYGKFGQKTRELELIAEGEGLGFGYTKVYFMNREKAYHGYVIGNQLYIIKEEKEWYNSFPAIASHVTAYARMHLWNLMKTAVLSNVYYVDTDSLFVNWQGYNYLQHWIDEYKLGYLKLEGVFEKMVIRGVKDYELEGIVKLKGVPKKAIELKPGVYVFTSFDKTKTLLREKVIRGVLERRKVKVLRREYDKGVVTKTGRVRPFFIEEK